VLFVPVPFVCPVCGSDKLIEDLTLATGKVSDAIQYKSLQCERGHSLLLQIGPIFELEI
jgi:hypothetical protein